jgi:hypothetical protein
MFVSRARAIATAQKSNGQAKALLEAERKSFLEATSTGDAEDAAALRAAVLVILDLARQGWEIRVDRSKVSIRQPDPERALHAEKERVRAQLHVERDEQLGNEAVQTFIRSMETRRVHGGRWVSVFSLMRDGADLARRLDELRAGAAGELRARALRALIRPYIQIVTDSSTCEWTGHRLLDIWRYFRHTWASPYRSTPGRTMMVLVRDAAVEPHAVMGIAALSSAAVQINLRDEMIGWLPDQLLESLERNPSQEMAAWLQGVIDSTMKEIYVEDLLEDGVVTLSGIKHPTPATLQRLDREARDRREEHRREASSVSHKKAASGADRSAEEWRREARSPLFRSKRADLLATLLLGRCEIRKHSGRKLTAAGLVSLLRDGEGRRVVRKLIKRAKAERVGTAMADITVCGAVAPYNALLGGKCVSMMLTSPEVVLAYRARYAKTCSVIASSIAARPIVRAADLVFLGTTSLYGVGSSQYNRLRMPCERAGGKAGEVIEFSELGTTEGYGTLQFGADTIKALGTLVAQRRDGQRVNSVFGEGVNPRLRKARAGLDELGFASDILLNHGSPRVIYGVALARNFQEYLLGLEDEAQYLLPLTQPEVATREIVEWWIDRWLSRRIERDEVIAEVSRHRLVHPIRHGARVVLPRRDDEQLTLIDA